MPYTETGETAFEELTVSSDIHLLSSDKFQEVMKEDQEIHFCISFTVVAGEIKKSSNTNGNLKDFQYSLPKLLSTIPFPCRFGPSYLCSETIKIKSGHEFISFFNKTKDDFEVEVVSHF
uniref:Uncharacterized protein n=1 Tax=Panagrolaimus davidi TaxID=227884 RepID=A0A914PTF5_9BILA